jgi:hypothetical protein
MELWPRQIISHLSSSSCRLTTMLHSTRTTRTIRRCLLIPTASTQGTSARPGSETSLSATRSQVSTNCKLRNARVALVLIHEARLEDYAFLRALGIPKKEISRRMGVTTRTLFRYDKLLA